MKKTICNILLIATCSLLLTGCQDHETLSIELVKEGKKELVIGKNSNAMELFNKAIKHDKENYEAWFYRGNCHVSLGMHHEGIEDFGKTIVLKPDFAAAFYNRGLAWSYLEDQKRACADWIEAESLGYPNISDRTRHCR